MVKRNTAVVVNAVLADIVRAGADWIDAVAVLETDALVHVDIPPTMGVVVVPHVEESWHSIRPSAPHPRSEPVPLLHHTEASEVVVVSVCADGGYIWVVGVKGAPREVLEYVSEGRDIILGHNDEIRASKERELEYLGCIRGTAETWIDYREGLPAVGL